MVKRRYVMPLLVLALLFGCSRSNDDILEASSYSVAQTAPPISEERYTDAVLTVRFDSVDLNIHFPQLANWGDNEVFRKINAEIRKKMFEYTSLINEPDIPYITIIQIDYDVTLATEQYFSVVFDGYIGHTRYNSIGFALVFDIHTGKRLELSDVVSDEKIVDLLDQYDTDLCRIINPGLESSKDELRELLTGALSNKVGNDYTEGFYLSPSSIGFIVDASPMNEHTRYEFSSER